MRWIEYLHFLNTFFLFCDLLSLVRALPASSICLRLTFLKPEMYYLLVSGCTLKCEFGQLGINAFIKTTR